jgi:hypothetical protein
MINARHYEQLSGQGEPCNERMGSVNLLSKIIVDQEVCADLERLGDYFAEFDGVRV